MFPRIGEMSLNRLLDRLQQQPTGSGLPARKGRRTEK
jgi:hypothetical protein